MLDNVKSYISNLPDVSFDDFYNTYMMEVQDYNIMIEIRTTIKSANKDVRQLQKLIASEHGKLVDDFD